MPNTLKKLKELFKDQLDAPVEPELLSFFVQTSPGPGVANYAMKKIPPKELKALKDYTFVSFTGGTIIPIFSPPQVQDVDSNEA